jgi:hypothetical protein
MRTEPDRREDVVEVRDPGAMARAAAFGAAVASLQIVVASSVRADPIEALIMPGPVSASHADLESKCSSCHRPFDGSAQRRLCIDCHKDVRADVIEKRGFHGRHARTAAAVADADPPYDVECRQCHSEHRGRDADIVGLDADLFNHDWTDYPLTGGHLTARCEDCHRSRTAYRSTPQHCISCHQDDDPHRGGLGEACADCHEVKGWHDAKFDHGTTPFALEGAHATVPCARCHPGARYRQTPADCVSCHGIDDAHDGRRGQRCGDCHGVTRWKRKPFDHDATKFPLRGSHRTVECNGCHPSSVFGTLSTRCADCHREDDRHNGSLGSACGSCHKESAWSDAVRFDHDLTAFPLIGLHQLQPCEACHTDPVYSETTSACRDCHADDDVHEAALGPNCGTCHTPNGWSRWLFDHDTQTRYPLVGAHDGLRCADCHGRGTNLTSLPSTRCHDCHWSDDVHGGAFGRACERCHGLDAFDRPKPLR